MSCRSSPLCTSDTLTRDQLGVFLEKAQETLQHNPGHKEPRSVTNRLRILNNRYVVLNRVNGLKQQLKLFHVESKEMQITRYPELLKCLKEALEMTDGWLSQLDAASSMATTEINRMESVIEKLKQARDESTSVFTTMQAQRDRCRKENDDLKSDLTESNNIAMRAQLLGAVLASSAKIYRDLNSNSMGKSNRNVISLRR